MINKATLIGYAGGEPELRHLDNGTPVAKFSVATNESYKDKNGEWQTQTEWHSVVLWRQLAERAAQQIKKGSLVYIDGKMTHRTSGEGDQKKYYHEVVASTFRLLEKREGGSSWTPPEDPQEQAVGSVSSEMPEDDDSLPF